MRYDIDDILKIVVFSLLAMGICCLVTWAFLPKKHIGYYLNVKNGSNSTQIYPSFQVMNNWNYYPDSIAFESLEKNESLEILKNLMKGE